MSRISTASTATIPLADLPLPEYNGLTEQQLRGANCVWDDTPLTTTTAVDLGERHADDGTSWFPRACRPCTRPRALKGLQLHSGMCEPCAIDHTQCPEGLALVRLVREARR